MYVCPNIGDALATILAQELCIEVPILYTQDLHHARLDHSVLSAEAGGMFD
jgi:hypothetical protein